MGTGTPESCSRKAEAVWWAAEQHVISRYDKNNVLGGLDLTVTDICLELCLEILFVSSMHV